MPGLTATRLALEEKLLNRYFQSFRIQAPHDPRRAGVIGHLFTNSRPRGLMPAARNRYGLWIPLGAFPSKRPDMFIVEPKDLRNAAGRKLCEIGVSGAMHLLEPDDRGNLQICHYNDTHWTPNVTLYKVVMKGRLWLEAYEMHLETGRNIEKFLCHM